MGKIEVLRRSEEVVVINVGSVCNACGAEKRREEPSRYEMPDMHSFTVGGGFESNFPRDLECLEWVACSDCLQKWIATFKTPPSASGMGAVDEPIPAFDSETRQPVLVHRGWVYPADGEHPTTLSPDWPENADFPPPGVYAHFKGEWYLLQDHVTHATTLKPMVLYRALYGDSRRYVRPVEMWSEVVERDGYSGPRFRWIGTGKRA